MMVYKKYDRETIIQAFMKGLNNHILERDLVYTGMKEFDMPYSTAYSYMREAKVRLKVGRTQ